MLLSFHTCLPYFCINLTKKLALSLRPCQNQIWAGDSTWESDRWTRNVVVIRKQHQTPKCAQLRNRSAEKEECRRFLAQCAGTEADSTKCASMLPASVHVLPIPTPGSAIEGTGVSAQFKGAEGPESNSGSEEGALVQDLLALREIASRANTAHNVYSRFFLACTDHHQTPERLATLRTINSHVQGVEDRQSSPWSSARHLRQVAMSLDFASKTPFSSCESRTQVFLWLMRPSS